MSESTAGARGSADAAVEATSSATTEDGEAPKKDDLDNLMDKYDNEEKAKTFKDSPQFKA